LCFLGNKKPPSTVEAAAAIKGNNLRASGKASSILEGKIANRRKNSQ
jgi:hypothetical protein